MDNNDDKHHWSRTAMRDDGGRVSLVNTLAGAKLCYSQGVQMHPSQNGTTIILAKILPYMHPLDICLCTLLPFALTSPLHTGNVELIFLCMMCSYIIKKY